MDKDLLRGVKQGLGFVLVVLFIFSVYAVGFHQTSDIVPGMFQGDYVFNGSVEVEDNVTINDGVYGDGNISMMEDIDLHGNRIKNQSPEISYQWYPADVSYKTAPADGHCSAYSDAHGNFCNDAGALMKIKESTKEVGCGPYFGCPAPMGGSADMVEDNNGFSTHNYNGLLQTSYMRVPSNAKNLNFWYNLRAGALDDSALGEGNRWKTTANEISNSDWYENLIVGVWRENGTIGWSDDVLLWYDHVGGNENVSSTKSIDVSGMRGEWIRVYTEALTSGGGDESIIQIDDVHFTDINGEVITNVTQRQSSKGLGASISNVGTVFDTSREIKLN